MRNLSLDDWCEGLLAFGLRRLEPVAHFMGHQRALAALDYLFAHVLEDTVGVPNFRAPILICSMVCSSQEHLSGTMQRSVFASVVQAALFQLSTLIAACFALRTGADGSERPEPLESLILSISLEVRGLLLAGRHASHLGEPCDARPSVACWSFA